MRKNLKEKRIGLELVTNEGYQVIVTDYLGVMKVKIQFLDDYNYTTWTQWHTLKKGEIKNPFHPSIYGVGYLGLDKNGQVPKVTDEHRRATREYELWSNMIKRCYSGKYPTYENCTVCDRWKCYANFLEDISKIKGYELWRNNPKQRISLNKDIYYAELGIETDCKEYNLLTTRFIPQSENTKEMIDRCDKSSKKVRCIETGIIYESMLQASEETGVNQGNISLCCRGKRKTAGGKHWEYVD